LTRPSRYGMGVEISGRLWRLVKARLIVAAMVVCVMSMKFFSAFLLFRSGSRDPEFQSRIELFERSQDHRSLNLLIVVVENRLACRCKIAVLEWY
jgi:hypothetical protein